MLFPLPLIPLPGATHSKFEVKSLLRVGVGLTYLRAVEVNCSLTTSNRNQFACSSIATYARWPSPQTTVPRTSNRVVFPHVHSSFRWAISCPSLHTVTVAALTQQPLPCPVFRCFSICCFYQHQKHPFGKCRLNFITPNIQLNCNRGNDYMGRGLVKLCYVDGPVTGATSGSGLESTINSLSSDVDESSLLDILD